ncbi:SdpA family antimicrobial peptide system protein [Spirosoma endophyticum]|nr:SdpA family antimicrobial peptide system protein [Spirosoma endophyticum]
MKNIYFLSIVSFWAYITIKVFTASMGINATNTLFIHRYVVSIFTPEGWGFFTRNPRVVQFVMERFEQPNAEIITVKNTDPSNLFGLSRKSRRVNLEFQRILSKLPDSAWIDNKYKIKILKLDGFKDQLIYIKSGKYKIKKYIPTPWVWAKYPENFKQEIDSLYIIIQ